MTTMSSGPAAPFRVFTSNEGYKGASLAIGRAHSSWFIIYARPYGVRMKRADLCLNFIVPGDPSTVSAPTSSAGAKLRFTIGGSQGKEALDSLLALRDGQGSPPVRVVRRFTGATGGNAKKYNLLAIVEVDIPDSELAYACARCGMWETMRGPRFLRCGGCKSRFYCSKEVCTLHPPC